MKTVTGGNTGSFLAGALVGVSEIGVFGNTSVVEGPKVRLIGQVSVDVIVDKSRGLSDNYRLNRVEVAMRSGMGEAILMSRELRAGLFALPTVSAFQEAVKMLLKKGLGIDQIMLPQRAKASIDGRIAMEASRQLGLARSIGSDARTANLNTVSEHALRTLGVVSAYESAGNLIAALEVLPGFADAFDSLERKAKKVFTMLEEHANRSPLLWAECQLSAADVLIGRPKTREALDKILLDRGLFIDPACQLRPVVNNVDEQFWGGQREFGRFVSLKINWSRWALKLGQLEDLAGKDFELVKADANRLLAAHWKGASLVSMNRGLDVDRDRVIKWTTSTARGMYLSRSAVSGRQRPGFQPFDSAPLGGTLTRMKYLTMFYAQAVGQLEELGKAKDYVHSYSRKDAASVQIAQSRKDKVEYLANGGERNVEDSDRVTKDPVYVALYNSLVKQSLPKHKVTTIIDNLTNDFKAHKGNQSPYEFFSKDKRLADALQRSNDGEMASALGARAAGNGLPAYSEEQELRLRALLTPFEIERLRQFTTSNPAPSIADIVSKGLRAVTAGGNTPVRAPVSRKALVGLLEGKYSKSQVRVLKNELSHGELSSLVDALRNRDLPFETARRFAGATGFIRPFPGRNPRDSREGSSHGELTEGDDVPGLAGHYSLAQVDALERRLSGEEMGILVMLIGAYPNTPVPTYNYLMKKSFDYVVYNSYGYGRGPHHHGNPGDDLDDILRESSAAVAVPPSDESITDLVSQRAQEILAAEDPSAPGFSGFLAAIEANVVAQHDVAAAIAIQGAAALAPSEIAIGPVVSPPPRALGASASPAPPKSVRNKGKGPKVAKLPGPRPVGNLNPAAPGLPPPYGAALGAGPVPLNVLAAGGQNVPNLGNYFMMPNGQVAFAGIPIQGNLGQGNHQHNNNNNHQPRAAAGQPAPAAPPAPAPPAAPAVPVDLVVINRHRRLEVDDEGKVVKIPPRVSRLQSDMVAFEQRGVFYTLAQVQAAALRRVIGVGFASLLPIITLFAYRSAKALKVKRTVLWAVAFHATVKCVARFFSSPFYRYFKASIVDSIPHVAVPEDRRCANQSTSAMLSQPSYHAVSVTRGWAFALYAVMPLPTEHFVENSVSELDIESFSNAIRAPVDNSILAFKDCYSVFSTKYKNDSTINVGSYERVVSAGIQHQLAECVLAHACSTMPIAPDLNRTCPADFTYMGELQGRMGPSMSWMPQMTCECLSVALVVMLVIRMSGTSLHRFLLPTPKPRWPWGDSLNLPLFATIWGIPRMQPSLVPADSPALCR